MEKKGLYALRIIKNCVKYLNGALLQSEILDMNDLNIKVENSSRMHRLGYVYSVNKVGFEISMMNWLLTNDFPMGYDKLPIKTNINFDLDNCKQIYHGIIAFIFDEIDRGRLERIEREINDFDYQRIYTEAFEYGFINAIQLYDSSVHLKFDLKEAKMVRFANYMDKKVVVYNSKLVSIFDKIENTIKKIIQKHKVVV